MSEQQQQQIVEDNESLKNQKSDQKDKEIEPNQTVEKQQEKKSRRESRLIIDCQNQQQEGEDDNKKKTMVKMQQEQIEQEKNLQEIKSDDGAVKSSKKKTHRHRKIKAVSSQKKSKVPQLPQLPQNYYKPVDQVLDTKQYAKQMASLYTQTPGNSVGVSKKNQKFLSIQTEKKTFSKAKSYKYFENNVATDARNKIKLNDRVEMYKKKQLDNIFVNDPSFYLKSGTGTSTKYNYQPTLLNNSRISTENDINYKNNNNNYNNSRNYNTMNKNYSQQELSFNYGSPGSRVQQQQSNFSTVYSQKGKGKSNNNNIFFGQQSKKYQLQQKKELENMIYNNNQNSKRIDMNEERRQLNAQKMAINDNMKDFKKIKFSMPPEEQFNEKVGIQETEFDEREQLIRNLEKKLKKNSEQQKLLQIKEDKLEIEYKHQSEN